MLRTSALHVQAFRADPGLEQFSSYHSTPVHTAQCHSHGSPTYLALTLREGDSKRKRKGFGVWGFFGIKASQARLERGPSILGRREIPKRSSLRPELPFQGCSHRAIGVGGLGSSGFRVSAFCGRSISTWDCCSRDTWAQQAGSQQHLNTVPLVLC